MTEMLRAASANVNKLTSALDSTSREINTIVAKVDSGGGTASKLINDPTLYNDMHHSLILLDSLVRDLKQHPRRYIPNVRLF